MRTILHRLAASAALTLATLLALAGCVKVDIALSIRSDDTVGGTMIMAVDRRLVAAAGQSEAALLARLTASVPTGATGVTSQRYEDATYVGTKFVLDGVPLAELHKEPNDLVLTHDRDAGVYTFVGEMDLRALDPAGFATAELANSLSIRISITFPGAVAHHNGRLEGTTVTWVARPGERLVVEAVAADGSRFPWVPVLALGVPTLLVLAGVVDWLVRRQRYASATPPPIAPSASPEVDQGVYTRDTGVS